MGMISSRSLGVGRDTKLFMTFPLPPSTCACRVCRGAREKGRVAATNTKDRALLPGGSWRRLQTQAFPPRSNSRNGPDRFAEELRQNLLGNGARRFITIPVFEHAVNLIEEDDAGTAAPRTLEDVSNAPLALANLLAHQLRDLGTYEVQVAHLRARTQNRCLSRAGRPVQKNARGWRDVEMAVFLPLKRPPPPTSMCKQGLMM